jgi:hypothetical protein
MLRARGLNVWLAEENIQPGDSIYAATSGAMEDATVIVLLISTAAIASPYCRREWSEALAASWGDPPKRLFPVLLDDVEIPAFLSSFQTVRARGIADLEFVTDLIARTAVSDTPDLQQKTEGAWQLGWRFEAGLVNQLAFSPDGTVLITAGDDGIAQLREVPTAALRSSLQSNRSALRCAAFSPDAHVAATGGDDGRVRIWDAATGDMIFTLKGDHHKVWSIAFSPDARVIASAGDGGEIRLWDTSTGTLKSSLRGRSKTVRCVAFSPDSQLAASGGDDGKVQLWDTSTNILLSTFRHPHGVALALAFSPGSRVLAVAGSDHEVRMWDLPSRELRSTLHGHGGAVRCVAFSPDGQLIASGTNQFTQIWSAATGEQITKLYHNGIVRSVAFSPDGMYLGTADNSIVRGWEISATLTRRRLSVIEADAYALRPSNEDLNQRRDSLTRLLDMKRETSGPDDPTVAATLVNLAVVAREQGDFDEAYDLLRQALELQRRIFGPEHATVAATLVNLADVAEHRGDLHEAYGLLLQVQETSKLTKLESRANEADWDSIYAKTQHVRQALDAAAENAGDQS